MRPDRPADLRGLYLPRRIGLGRAVRAVKLVLRRQPATNAHAGPRLKALAMRGTGLGKHGHGIDPASAAIAAEHPIMLRATMLAGGVQIGARRKWMFSVW